MYFPELKSDMICSLNEKAINYVTSYLLLEKRIPKIV